jgi:hypothetical protein
VRVLQINSRYEFFDEIDLSRPGRQYVTADSETASDQTYKLLSVLVHAGVNQGGHYWAYVRPDGKTWYKFDDETVTKVEQGEAIDDQFGEDPPARGMLGNIGMGMGFGRTSTRSHAVLQDVNALCWVFAS